MYSVLVNFLKNGSHPPCCALHTIDGFEDMKVAIAAAHKIESASPFYNCVIIQVK